MWKGKERMAKNKPKEGNVSERMTVKLLVDGDEQQSILKIRDVDSNFADYLAGHIGGGNTEMATRNGLLGVSDAISGLCAILGDVERRVKENFESRGGDPDRYLKEVVAETYRRKRELFGLITKSACSGRTFEDLNAAFVRFSVAGLLSGEQDHLVYEIDLEKWWGEHKVSVHCAVEEPPKADTANAKAKPNGKPVRTTIDFRVNGEKDHSVFKIHDVDENFVSYIGLEPKRGKAVLRNEGQLRAVNDKCVTIYKALSEIEHRGDRSPERHGEISREMSKVCKLITGSVCSRNTFWDLVGTCDDSVRSFWFFLVSRDVEEWWKGGTFIEVSWGD